MMTPAVATLLHLTLLPFCQIRMKGLVPAPMSIPQVPIVTSLGRKRLKESGSCMTLSWLGTGTGLCTLSWRIGLWSARIEAGLLGIWSGCGRRGSERVLILSVLRKGISGFPLVCTVVGIRFGPWKWISFGTGSRFFLTFPLSNSSNLCLSLVFFPLLLL